MVGASRLTLGVAASLLAHARSVGAEVVMLTDSQAIPGAGGAVAVASASSSCDSALIQGPLDVAGLPGPTFVAGSGGRADGQSLVIGHNSGMSLFSKCEEDWKPESITQLKLLGRSITFTVDLSKVGCACNLAFYLISAPAKDSQGAFNEGSNRLGQPPYYCDANQVGGQWCPEVDIMEANNHALQSTLHKCDKPSNGHYSFCDRSGCAQNTNDKHGSYGPSARYTINTLEPFELETEFPEEGGVLLGMRAILRQGDKKVMLAHEHCDLDYLAALSEALKDGMSLRITYWGDSAQTMAWMDSPPCGGDACSGKNAGDAVISKVTISPKRDIAYFRSHGFKGHAQEKNQAQQLEGNPWWHPESTQAPQQGNQWWHPESAPAPATAAPTTAAPTTAAPAVEPTSGGVGGSSWAPDTSAPWQCHQYVGDQQETLWCASAGIQGGFEYEYNGGQASPCGGCWCCKRKAKKGPLVAGATAWIVSDRSDPLFGQIVPNDVVADASLAVQMEDHGVVEWKGDKHFVKKVASDCAEGPCEVSISEEGGSLGIFLQKFSASRRAPEVLAERPMALVAAGAAGLAFLAALLSVACCTIRRLRSRRSSDIGSWGLSPSASGISAPTAAMFAAAAAAAGGNVPAPGGVPFNVDGMARASGASPMRKRVASGTNLSATPVHMRRSGSSCQKLLSFSSQDLEA